jgi:acyl-CoA synthetase (AMP-forming)/AMP-acid ligase II
VAEFAVIYYGVLRAGGVVVPMNPLLKAREVAYCLRDCDARLIFAWHGFAADAQAGAEQADATAVIVDPATFPGLVASAAPDDRVADREAADTAVILYTSGTTGSPKGAELTHASLGRNADVVRTDLFQLTADDVIFGGLPLFHAFGCQVLEGYGLSETSPVASFNHPDRPRKPGSIGTPIRGVQMRVVDGDGNEVPRGDVGEIVIRGHNVMKGYWRRPEATADAIPDGWFRTGDVGRADEDGYFEIVDRKKDLIIRGGYNVYPREIEEVLYEHPAVAEAAVIGLPHEVLGEEVGAAVVVKPGADVTAGQLRDYVKAQVAAYKYPRAVWLTSELPKGPTGKIVKREIVLPDDLRL